MTFKNFLLLILSSLTTNTFISKATSNDIAITVSVIQNLRHDLRLAFDASGHDKPLLATTVRLIFHDCAGPRENGDILPSISSNSLCNGCVSFSNELNFGLETGAVIPLELVYISYQSWMSRADFWAAAATIAIEYAQELDRSNDVLPLIPYYFGRSDCITSPDGIQTRQFPDAHAGWHETINWFQRFLGFSRIETIAILGAHTLGKTHQRFSGFETRPWVHRSFVLNNAYYQDIIAKKWSPVEVNCRSPFGCKWEWHTQRNDKTLMLNTDMAIWNDIDRFLIRRTGEVTCDWKTCPLNPSTSDITQSYATNNQLWLVDFANAFERLITMGYGRNGLVAINVPRPVVVGVAPLVVNVGNDRFRNDDNENRRSESSDDRNNGRNQRRFLIAKTENE